MHRELHHHLYKESTCISTTMPATEEKIPRKHMIALYYCYPPAPGLPKDKLEPHKLFHQETCTNLNLGGRIRVSEEGINGVLSGTEDALREYEANLRKELMQLVVDIDQDDAETTGCDDPTAEWLDIKYCHLRNDIPMEQQLFSSLQVKITREVVSLIEPTPSNQGKNKGKRCRQRRKQKRKEKQMQEKLTEVSVGDDESSKDTVKLAPANEVVNIEDWKNNTPAQHLSPEEWNNKLLELAKQEEEGSHEESDTVLLDTRNIYETRVGHFAVPHLKTMFPNTRKFSSLPLALNTEEAAEALAGKNVFMYCTGGVRCERAGTYLRALSDSNSGAWQGKEKPKAIFQLKGGIQKYLEEYGEQVEPKSDGGDNTARECLYRGKNFVFDQRRTDPVIGKGITSKTASDNSERVSLVGQCIICSNAHDDYDNGFSPCDEKEARCCRCRVLVLVCNDCRPKVRSCGEPEADNVTDLLCGGTSCIDEGNVADNVETIRF
eukprot:scaffold33_cov147-Skeletonema_menzelii.AAC.4